MKNRIKKSQESITNELSQLKERILKGQETVTVELKNGQKRLDENIRSVQN
jgi:hypothetical protein